eukprot:6189109-Pleurochrysis_carterae.AAC.1
MWEGEVGRKEGWEVRQRRKGLGQGRREVLLKEGDGREQSRVSKATDSERACSVSKRSAAAFVGPPVVPCGQERATLRARSGAHLALDRAKILRLSCTSR